MTKISPSLQSRLEAGGPEAPGYAVMITLEPSASFQETLQRIRELGVKVTSSERAISLVSGVATRKQVERLAGFDAVSWVELDDIATAAMDASRTAQIRELQLRIQEFDSIVRI